MKIIFMQYLMYIGFCLNVWFMMDAFERGWHTDMLIHAICAVVNAYGIYSYTGEGQNEI